MILYSLIILGATAIGAMTGLGGGVIIKPMLDLIGLHDVVSINFYSACAVLTMCIYNIYKQIRLKNPIQLDIVLTLSLGSALGGILGSHSFDFLTGVLGHSRVSQVQSILLICILGFVMISMKRPLPKLKNTQPVIVIIIGLALGILSAFIGIGGGPLNVIVFMQLFGFSFRSATVYSIATILFSQITSLTTFMMGGGIATVDVSYLYVILPSAFVGGLIGTEVSRKVSERILQSLFKGVMMILIVISLFNFVKA